MAKNNWEVEKYPLYHCERCGYFFNDAAGTMKDTLHGQQSSVTQIVCTSCSEGKGVFKLQLIKRAKALARLFNGYS